MLYRKPLVCTPVSRLSVRRFLYAIENNDCMTKKTLLFLSLLSFFLSLRAQPKYEVRAVWLATVYGLDWPRVKATDAASRTRQQQALCMLLDSLAAANFNTVFFQARLRGDVAYRSAFEPYSAVFTGSCNGNPGYDPLAFAVEECHKRGMECHAWFVTFPLGSDKSVKEQGLLSPVKRHAALCKRHNGAWYLDPGLPGTADYLASMVRELVAAYDIDGIHFDYIRYPEKAEAFPDKQVYARYGKDVELTEWRRRNIDRLVTRLYDTVKAIKPWVQVSSAPLGKYGPTQQMPDAGWTAYGSVYQDPKKWMAEGKHDMVVPMMYYRYEHFFPFVDDWVAGSHGRLVVPGLGVYRLDEPEAGWELATITDQMDYTRYFGGAGCAFFRCASLLDNAQGVYKELKDVYYRYPALLPPLTWLNDSVPSAPAEVRAERSGGELKLSWEPVGEHGDGTTYTVYYGARDSLDTSSPQHILATGVQGTELYLPVDTVRERLFFFGVSASTRYRVESGLSPTVLYYLSPYSK